jgi:ABC-type nitrate/sulfonate/bicarbonate transport system substrate-binding protein
MQGLSDGTYDLAYTAFDNVLAWSGRQGADIVAVAQIDNAVDVPLYVRPEIKTWEDLRNKTLAVDAVDTAYALVLRKILLAHDLDLDRHDYQIVGVGGPQQRLNAMQSGQAVGGIMGGPYSAAAETVGMVPFADHTEVLPDLPGLVIAANSEWADAHQSELSAFLRAWINGGNTVQADRAAAGSLLINLFNVTSEQTAGLLPLDWQEGRINAAGLRSVLDLRTQFGYVLPHGTDLSAYIDTSFYDAATAQE